MARMNRRNYLTLMGGAAGALAIGATSNDIAFAQQARPADNGAPTTSTVEDRERRMQWWHAAKFGMFIHWGLYSTLSRHEWVMENEGISVSEYERLAPQFKPIPNAARAWARLAKNAGMKYMVMTTKHHEGFCNFDTKLTDYCAPKQGPGRDLVREYVDAARAEGLRFGFYYSLMDWHHPDGARCKTDEAAQLSYRKMYEAYARIFQRCGLKTIAVEADTGVMGGKFSHEFMVPAETGENEVVFCGSCSYAANIEKASSALPKPATRAFSRSCCAAASTVLPSSRRSATRIGANCAATRP